MSNIKGAKEALQKAGVSAKDAEGMSPQELIKAAEKANPDLKTNAADVSTATTFLK